MSCRFEHRARLAIFGLVLAGFAAAAESPLALPRAPDSAWVKRLFDGWRAAVPPRQLIGNIYYVGARGVSAYLITTPAGHILLDTGFEDTVPIIKSGVEQLGFRVSDLGRDFEATFAMLRSLPCDIFFAPHGGQFAMAQKLERLDRGEQANPFVDPAGWQRLIASAEKAFRDRLALERAAAK